MSRCFGLNVQNAYSSQVRGREELSWHKENVDGGHGGRLFGEEGPSEEVHELEQTLLAVPMASGVQSPILK